MANNSFATFFGAAYPLEGNVLDSAQTYGDSINVLNGTYDPGAGGVVPSANDVRETVAVGNTTGNLHVPPPEKVEENYLYDTNRTIPGTLSTATDYPIEDNVRAGVDYAFNTLQGNYLPALEAYYLAPYMYGANGVEFTGTLQANALRRSPMNQDETIIRGDSYVKPDRQLVWMEPSAEYEPWPDMTGASLLFRGVSESDEIQGVPTLGDDNGTPILELELSSEESKRTSGVYRYDIEATLANGQVWTVARGNLTIELTYTNP